MPRKQALGGITREIKAARLMTMASVAALVAVMGAPTAAFAAGPGFVCFDATTLSDGGATTLYTTDTACGTGATATGDGGIGPDLEGDSSAFGNFATATGPGATAVGNFAQATASDATALGDNSTASGQDSTAVGADSSATGEDSTAVGSAATANGDSATAIGANALADGSVNGVPGDDANTTAIGARAQATNGDATAIGVDSLASGEGATANGFDARATASDASAFGERSRATGQDSTAIGTSAQATAEEATATGNESKATGAFSTANGAGANASGDGSTAVGAGSSAAFTNSAAFGAGATATLDNEQVFGTTSNTYTTPGITSGLSASRQSGPLDIVTTDAAGHLASDGGSVFNSLSKLEAGVAIAMAQQNPDLISGESFGIAMNAGFFDQSQAIGFSAEGVLGRNLFGYRDRLAVSGGVGFSVNEPTFGNRTADTQVGGHVGAQLTW